MSRITYIKGAAQVATVAGASEAPKRGAAMADAGILENAGIVVEGDRIAFVGPDAEARRYVAERGGADVVIDAAGKTVTPGLVDPHTHLVFAGYREVEWVRRLQGTPYLEILREGGGILETMRRTRAASEEELVEAAKRRLDRFLLHGVTTVEAKSGYGLTVADELKQLRAVRRLHEAHPVDV
ncbi:amidohydrolase family protein, partial [Calditerricola satsumensis]